MGHVYFIQNQHDGYIKIGFTTRDVRVRLREWKHLIPHKLVLLGCMPGSRQLENYLKNWLFYPYMILPDHDVHTTEWFEPAPEIIAYIEDQCMTSISTAATAVVT